MSIKAISLLLILTLSGCSSGPSADEIKTAMQDYADAQVGRGAVVFEEISNVSCKEVQNKPGYFCSFSLTSLTKLKVGTSRVTNPNASAQFTKTDNKWVRVPPDQPG
ncbi:hypothetical protein [Acidisphaera sp. S103]|uniref:hypothetical protein n=1 Tax=Acidisphaera sp. S103 TaxID=1747223 RepID=UPI00131A740C|nr:hypothetical protein [Acidisphaera sp. S103]